MLHEAETLRFSPAQFRLITTPEQFPAFVGGYGSGKTAALATRCLIKKFAYPKQNVGYYLPTFDLVRNIAYPRFSEKLIEFGVEFKLNKQFSYIEIAGGDGGQIIFRTMDSPDRIVGYEVADSFVDEIDVLKTENARDVWIKVMARNRQKKPDGSPNTIAVGCTPEGFKFVYERWKRNPKPGYELIRASTYTNARNLPEDYIGNLLASYPTQLIAAYLEGEFTNLAAGTVYAEFDRKKNNCASVLLAGDPTNNVVGDLLHIGMDFNVGRMAAAVAVIRNGDPHFVDELTHMFDTPAAINTIKQHYPHNRVVVYPDASGGSRKSNNASVSDIALLKQANFDVIVDQSNPAVKDRVISMNTMICNGERKRRMKVNMDMCPVLSEALEKQSFDKNGEPDKQSGLDHINDAAGYFICKKYPVRSTGLYRMPITGI